MDSEISYVAVALFTDIELENKIIDISESFYEKYDSWWRLSRDKFPPHVSLWLGYIPKKNEAPLIEEVRRVVKTSQPIQISLGEVDIVASANEYYIKQNINKTKQLIDLHYLFLEKLNRFREDYIEPKYLDIEKQKTMSEQMVKNIFKYGTRFVADLYDPHISISYVKRNCANLNDIRSNIPKLEAQHESRKVIVFKQKESGKSIDILAEADIL